MKKKTTGEPGPEGCASLSDEQLVQLLWTESDRIGRGVVDELARRTERVLPLLADLVNDEDAWEYDVPPECWAVVHATFALSATGSQDAVAPLLQAIRRGHEMEIDWITDPAGELFNRIGPDCFAQVRAAYAVPDEDPFARWSCLCAMASLSLQREDLQPLVIQTAAAILRDEEDVDLNVGARHVLADYYALGRTADVLEALGADPQELPTWLTRRGDDEPFAHAQRDPLVFYDPSAIAARQERWRRLEEEGEDPESDEEDDGWYAEDGGWDEELPDGGLPERFESDLPFVRAQPKVGRNDPCPCGSGRKFKKCCQGSA